MKISGVPKLLFLGIIIFLCFFLYSTAFAQGETLYGIHWWGYSGHPIDEAPKSLLGLPDHPAWVTETVLTHSALWWEANWFTPLYEAMYGWNARIITRVDYTWDDCVPAPTDPNHTNWPSVVVSNVVNPLHQWCNKWVVGNEPNLFVSQNWPDRKISPEAYAESYRRFRNAVHNSAHQSPLGPHLVLLAGPSPGGVEGPRWMDGNEYFGKVLDNLQPHEVDGFAIHAYGWGVNDFSESYQYQMRVIDQKGFGDKPVWMTEFNRYTIDSQDEQNSAKFVRDSFEDVNAFNQTPGSHNIIGMTWFVYDYDQQAGGGWNNYAIEYWKHNGFPYGDSRNLYTAFEETVALRYPAGIYGSRPAVPWVDRFDTPNLNQTPPDPNWKVTTHNQASVQQTGGQLRLIGSSGRSSVAEVRNGQYMVYDDFVVNAKLHLANAAGTIAGAESNAEIRFRTDTTGKGYSLSFKAGDSPNLINLRRSDTWQVIKNKQIYRNLPSGTVLYVRIECEGERIKIGIGSYAGGVDVVDWDFTDDTFTAKGFLSLSNYQMMDARFDYFSFSPLSSDEPTGIQGVVKDTLGNLIGDVNIISTCQTISTTTDPDGVYTVENIPPGAYEITASKTNYVSQTQNDIIMHAGFMANQDFVIRDSTPPGIPAVWHEKPYQTDSDSITLHYFAEDDESPITQYRVAISSSASANDVIPGGGWLVLGPENSHTRSGLSLSNGQRYYGLVQARNAVNLISSIGVSDGALVAKGVPSIAAAKSEPNDITIAIKDRIVTATFDDCIYIADPDKTSGIRIDSIGVSEGTRVDIAGKLSTISGERRISGDALVTKENGLEISSVGMTNKSLGGSPLNVHTPGISQGVGLNNIGRLVTVWGKVVCDTNLLISDGSVDTLKINVPNGIIFPKKDDYVIITGISSVESEGETIKSLLRVRKQADIIIVE